MKSLIALVALYVVAVCTSWGQKLENWLVDVGYAEQARISRIMYSIGPPPLKAEEATIVVGVALILLVAVLRRRWLLAVAGAGVPVASIACAELLNKVILPRPDISHAPVYLTERSFPSGHVAIVAGLTLGAILVATPRARFAVAAVGTLWLAVIVAAVQTLSWHRVSDVIASTLIACIWYGVALRLVPGTRPLRKPHTVPVLAVAALGAVLASSRTDAYGKPLVFAVVAVFCAALVWFTAARRSPADEARSR